MTMPQQSPVGTLDRIEAMAPAFLAGKAARLLECTPEDADAWLDRGRTAGLKFEAGLVHSAHLQQRISQLRRDAFYERANTTDPARIAQIDARLTEIDRVDAAIGEKLSDIRLSEEQRISDGYRLIRPLLDPRMSDLTDTTDTLISHGCSRFSYRNMVRICGGTRECVRSQQHRPFPPAFSDALNRYFGTDIDFVAYSVWESGQQLNGYVPWYNGAPDNRSGVTIGTGNDLAAASLDSMQNFARLYTSQMPEPPGLIQKITPYIGLRKQVACNFLSDHPLSLTIPEVEWLDAWRFYFTLYPLYPTKPFARVFDDARASAVNQGLALRYPPDTPARITPFQQLPRREQTILFSRLSHAPNGIIGAGNIDLLRTRNWDAIWVFYADKMRKGYSLRYKQENDFFNNSPP